MKAGIHPEYHTATVKCACGNTFQTRSTQAVIRTLCEIGENWRQPHYPIRQLALKQGPELTGFSAETLASGLDDLFSQFTTQNFQALLIQELGHSQRLEGLQASQDEQRANRASAVRGPELLVHFAGGLLPNPPLISIVLGLLTRSAQFVKCGSGQAFLPRMFAHSLYDAEPKLGACLEIAEWPGGTDLLERELFGEADCVTATGNDETLAAILNDTLVCPRAHSATFLDLTSVGGTT